jgi:glyoxylase-like metal-dependent hydrolase (beta-lactamase superfamily II)
MVRFANKLLYTWDPQQDRSFFHDRRQMPVGQGGFHVGGLELIVGDLGDNIPQPGTHRFNTSDFLYVYDCGSEPQRHVHREIADLLTHRPDRRLDMLFLSHFDRDHICGTPRLLRKKDGFTVDTIVLPFIDMDARIVALARAAATTLDFGGQIDQFFVDMVFDPAATLARFGPRQIIFVRADGDEGPFPVDGTDPDTPPETSKDGDRERVFAREGSVSVDIKPAYPDDPQRRMELIVQPPVAKSQVMVVRHATLVAHDANWSLLWKLAPWVRQADPAAVASFRTFVERLFKWAPGSFKVRVKEPTIRKQMVTTKRTKLAAAYKFAFGDKNMTSMCVYSGLLEPNTRDALALPPQLPAHGLTKIGWLGTGDAHLSKPAERAALTHGYGGDLDHVSTFVFPHHGSITNSDPAHLVCDADRWVAAADPIHDWKHPHWALEAAVEGLRKTFHHVRSPVKTGFHETFIVSPKLGKP